jgi:Neuraminidase (sialidase)
LAGRYSSDGGSTWTWDDVVVLANEGGMNVMSVSLLRLQDGSIALFYLRKNSEEDCRPLMRISVDEAQTWSDPITIIPDSDIGYYVLNNSRVIQLQGGRLLAPVCLHKRPGWEKTDAAGELACFLSDDSGRTWHVSQTRQAAFSSARQRVYAQEPGVVERKDGSVLMYIRSNVGLQYYSSSNDEGETWSPPVPSPISSPCSPATIKRLPDGDLLLVWNDHRNIAKELESFRTPFTAAISKDEGKSWICSRVLEDDPDGWYCYTAIEIVGDQVVLGHCAGTRDISLATTQITRFPISIFAEK